jgi:hypothetical protein
MPLLDFLSGRGYYYVMQDFEAWLEHGIKMGWCGPAVCYTHDGLPTSEPEDAEFEDGADPCLHILRLYEDLESKSSIEANHSPSLWRVSGQTLPNNVS